MSFEHFAAGLPVDRTAGFTDPQQMEAALRELGVEQPMRQLGSGEFKARLAWTSCEHGEFFSDRYNRTLAMQLSPPDGSVGLVIPRTTSHDFVAAGRRIRNDGLIFCTPDIGLDIVAPRFSGSEAIAIPKERFNAAVQALDPTMAVPESTTVLDGDTAALHALRGAVAAFVADPQKASPGGAGIITQAVTWIGQAAGSAEQALSRNVRQQVAMRARDYIEAHYADAVHAEDLCRVTGVGVRTLQRSFREHFGVTFSRYLKAVRLDSARRELMTAHPNEASVTDVAMANGCTHLGRFSVEFRSRFGELPSETLTRHPG